MKRPSFPTIDRRRLLQGGLAVAAAAPLALGRARAADLSASTLPGGLKLISGGGTSVVCAPGPEGAVMVDVGYAASADQVLARVLAETKASRIGTLFNTCWRLEQTGGNDKIAAAGARIIAHENTRLWMTTEIDCPWEKKVYEPRAPGARPTKTFYTKDALAAGPEQIEYGYLLQARTDGDAYIFFRNANVIAVGGAVAGKGWPVIDIATGGWIGGHIRGLETLAKLADDKTVIVPADGTLLTKADLDKQHAMYVAIMGKLQPLLESGLTPTEVVAKNPAAEYAAERGDPSAFVDQSFRSLWGPVRQFRAV